MSKLYSGLIIFVFIGIVTGLAFYKGDQHGADRIKGQWDAAALATTTAVAEDNITIVTERKKVNHENQNRDHDALVRNGCERGWVRDRENCPADSATPRQVRDNVLRHKGHNRNHPAGFNE